MADQIKNPDTSPKDDQEKPQNPVSGFGVSRGNAWFRLVSRIPQSGKRYIGIGIIVLFALLIIFVMRNYAAGVEQTRQEELHATAQALAQPRIDAVTGGEAGALMPSFSQAASIFSQGISRRASLDTIIPSRPRTEITTYTVAQGDTVFGIADKFGLQPESILWFNFDELQDNPNAIKPDQVLNIPPIDGVMHKYKAGEHLAAIADQYSYSTVVTPQDIIDWPGNDMDPYETNLDNPNIPDGSLLVIPTGSRPLRDWGPPAISRSDPAVAAYYGPGACGAIGEGAVGNGTFVWPTSLTYLSGNDWNPPIHNGIDIAGAEGNPVYAVDSGVVVYSGASNVGFGNLLVIDHGTGFQSAYAHLSAVAVTCGQNVSQSERVGAVGNTGNSSGPHLHFELLIYGFGKVNPWDYLPAQ